MMNNIGVTYIFGIERESIVKGLMISQILVFDENKDVKTAIGKVSDLIKRSIGESYIFMGVSDLFVVDQKISPELNEKFLGRYSEYSLKEIGLAEEKCLSLKEVEESILNVDDLFNVSFIYFHDDPEGAEFNFVFVIHTVLDKNEFINNHVKEGINEFAKSKSFLKKICEMSVDELDFNSIKFIGIEELYKLGKIGFKEYIGEFDSIAELNEELLSDSEIDKLLGECLDDMTYIG